jgi:hypothetical protein
MAGVLSESDAEMRGGAATVSMTAAKRVKARTVALANFFDSMDHTLCYRIDPTGLRPFFDGSRGCSVTGDTCFGDV